MGFNIGDIVAIHADPSRVGPVIQILQSVDGFGRYRVLHEAGSMREYAEDQPDRTTAVELPRAPLRRSGYRLTRLKSCGLRSARLSNSLTSASSLVTDRRRDDRLPIHLRGSALCAEDLARSG
ncbi:hypothetical protein [Micromonospora sp. NPDC005206]|uniref:hypothetical protein n=1 Tax=Micromonospora sp. NPDC005206 TaxID=3157022 RepID=UPI0033B485F2